MEVVTHRPWMTLKISNN